MMAASTSPPNWVRGRVIGRGSYGSVYLGFHRGSGGGAFAVKSVELNSSHPDRIDSLENEIRILGSLDYSPYVVRYLGDDADGTRRNLYLELLPGGTVTDAAAARRSGGKLSAAGEEAVRSHTRCVVSALRHVHSRGIVHCDVKGRNVIVGTDSGVAKLADFGSAIRAGSRCGPRGSPLWMAPEVVRGERQGSESDVWALGCTVIEMVTGRPAWEDKGAETLSRIGFSGEVPEFPAELSAQGRDFLEKCLRRDHRERWSCDQLLQHPFVASETAAAAKSGTDSSPRCVLDWVNSEFEEELESEYDDDDRDSKGIESVSGAEPVSDPRERFRELCRGGGVAAWESEDGWVVVRDAEAETNSARELAREAASCCCRRGECEDDSEREEVGTSSGFRGNPGAERESGKGWPEYLKEGREQVEGEWRRSCRHGTGEEEEEEEEAEGFLAVAAVALGIYSLCSLLLVLPHFLLAVSSRSYNNYCIINKQHMKHFGPYYLFYHVLQLLSRWLSFFFPFIFLRKGKKTEFECLEFLKRMGWEAARRGQRKMLKMVRHLFPISRRNGKLFYWENSVHQDDTEGFSMSDHTCGETFIASAMTLY